MSLNTDYRSPVQLTGAVRAAIAAISGNLPLNAWLPNLASPTLTYSFDASGKRKVDLAQYRAFDTPAPHGREFGTITKSGRIPPISRKEPVTEYDELQFSARNAQLGALIDQHAENLARGVAFRLELARAEALCNGKLALNENGLVANIDYGRDSALTVTLTGTKVWSNSESTPIDDVESWVELIRAKQGQAPTTMLVTQDVVSTLSKNPDIIAVAVGRTDNLPSRVTYDDVADVFSAFGITTFTVIDRAYSQFDIGQTIFPAGSVLLLPDAGTTSIPVGSGSLGHTEFGVPAEALQPSYGIPSGEQAGPFAGVFHKEDPEGLEVLVSLVAMPILENANSTLYASVL